MGCEVNGPGEAAAADVGVAYGHNGVGLLFRDGKIVKRMKAEELEDAVVAEAIAIASSRIPGESPPARGRVTGASYTRSRRFASPSRAAVYNPGPCASSDSARPSSRPSRRRPPTRRSRRHKLLVRAGFIRQLGAGIYDYLPLAKRIAHEDRGDRPRGDGRHRRPGVLPARPPPRGDLEGVGPLGRDGRQHVPAEGPQGRRLLPRHDARGDLHRHRARRAALVPAAAAGLVPDPDEVPRRAAPEVRPPARAPVHDEGRLLVRRGPRPGSTRATRTSARRTRRSSPAAASTSSRVQAHSGAMGGSRVVRVHGPHRRRRGPRRRLPEVPLRGEHRDRDLAHRRAEQDGAGARAAARSSRRRASRTIEALEQPPYGVAARRQLKTLVYVADEKLVLAVVRGDQELNEAKLQTATGAAACSARRTPRRSRALMGARAGSLGAVGLHEGAACSSIPSLADRKDMVTGANEDGFHLRGVDVARDVLGRTRSVAELRTVQRRRGLPALRRHARRLQGARGRPHLQARDEVLRVDEGDRARRGRQGRCRS